ncbi:MAG: Thermostable monoacylglycerol lipase [Candidatus Moranbacteria bacterium GW2011_GWC1_45_18]|nr:MAG: Thermostable monoacylglycerol lipase [Candidatus Moranbacteria bacterium GW2011_GWC2_40_12]KKT34200.1 MAG: Thermostable monoacylglycerol lipase [Candidatus Moranbacteria bacterium GW2011_GWF2_44_10]KKT72391.1 MAG: Thermostable monoacylglycerol lipase [Candidatus Moranbacteria bacterium GW2011_GWF1_44_4]KKU00589.1 MAG: Thermostable monoacylglycerol lipase [Candidatus Moranbacteria bacterium GW2011_GWC1_45_18]OGI24432.1 MAG: hypothetical protein A2194_01495 [Candidatus Moranbacteria bacte
MNPEKKFESNPFFLKGDNGIGVLLLHGWTSPPDELRPLAEHLNSFGYTVSAPLLLGHGTRPEDLEHVKWKDWLSQSREELEKLKEHLSFATGALYNDTKKDRVFYSGKEPVAKVEKKIFVGGISMGGNLALMVSDDKSVAGIFTMGAAMHYKLHYLVKVCLFFMGLTKKYRNKYYPFWVRKKMGDRKVYLRYPIESAKEVVRLSDATRKFLPQVTKPIFIMQSTSDHMVSRNSPKMITSGVKSKIKEIFWIENAYHVFAGKKEVWEKIESFIERIVNCES